MLQSSMINTNKEVKKMSNFLFSYQDKHGDWSDEIIEAESLEAAELWATEYGYHNGFIDWVVE